MTCTVLNLGELEGNDFHYVITVTITIFNLGELEGNWESYSQNDKTRLRSNFGRPIKLCQIPLIIGCEFISSYLLALFNKNLIIIKINYFELFNFNCLDGKLFATLKFQIKTYLNTSYHFSAYFV